MRNARVLAAVLLAAMTWACGDEDEEDPAAEATAAPGVPGALMAASGFSVEWGRPGVPSPVEPGASFAVGVSVKNTGDQIWLDPRSADPTTYASGAVRLTSRWWGPGATTTPSEWGPRGDLLSAIHPGQSAVLAVPVVAPSQPGTYELQLELVQENFSFFEPMGAKVLRVPVTVKAVAPARP